MILQLVGCSHHQCPVELRELLAIGEPNVPKALASFQRRFPASEAVILSTCHRTEIYTASDDLASVPTREEIAIFLAEQNGTDVDRTMRGLFVHRDEQVVRHLFTVAASLDSMVLGETQIVSQVKRAYRMAAEEASAGQWTHAAFQAAIRVAKRVATETTLHRHRGSIASVAIGEFATRVLRRLDNKSVVVIGAGEMGKESLQYLTTRNVRDLTVVNRNRWRAIEVASQFGTKMSEWAEIDELLVSADLIISTTGSAESIVDLDRFRRAESRRDPRPLVILDLAMPRDFDAAIGRSRGVSLYSINDLARACTANLQARKQELPAAQAIVEEETRRFRDDLQHRASVPTIRQLRESAEAIRDAELSRLWQKLDRLSDSDRHLIEQSFHRVVNKILHPPLESLREHADLLHTVRRLFRLREDGPLALDSGESEKEKSEKEKTGLA